MDDDDDHDDDSSFIRTIYEIDSLYYCTQTSVTSDRVCKKHDPSDGKRICRL